MRTLKYFCFFFFCHHCFSFCCQIFIFSRMSHHPIHPKSFHWPPCLVVFHTQFKGHYLHHPFISVLIFSRQHIVSLLLVASSMQTPTGFTPRVPLLSSLSPALACPPPSSSLSVTCTLSRLPPTVLGTPGTLLTPGNSPAPLGKIDLCNQ